VATPESNNDLVAAMEKWLSDLELARVWAEECCTTSEKCCTKIEQGNSELKFTLDW